MFCLINQLLKSVFINLLQYIYYSLCRVKKWESVDQE